jgi:tetratricopeptide (TPR) repeat protein
MMQDAALTLSRSRDQGWGYIGRWLEREQAAADDAELSIMRATYLSVRMHFLLELDPSDLKTRRELEREIEVIVTQAAPAVRNRPILKLAAAKLLFDLLGDHLGLAEQLTAESLSEGDTFAAALALSGALQAHRGDLAGALASFDQALALMPPSPEFQVYLRIKRSVVLLAAGDHVGADAELAKISQIKPGANRDLQLFYLHPDDRLPPEAAEAIQRLSPAMAQRIVAHLYFRFARYFAEPAHPRAIMAGAMHHLVPRFGIAILPPEARRLFEAGDQPQPGPRRRPSR